ncbi:hypothetical protein SAMN02910293_02143 [Streptococcus henryi]|jgi:hypothetical protein|uniref:Uncharacterized protein n=1 Tax=Streptococcus henryi TaxID=439219 RepID=A0A1G6DDY3_9STRE|nr:hypothetical protein [Streptococcus henryi]SDB43363.1 hypothetical protein SAMN02910293_02143 [Streptococcus henryi]
MMDKDELVQEYIKWSEIANQTHMSDDATTAKSRGAGKEDVNSMTTTLKVGIIVSALLVAFYLFYSMKR